MLLWTNIWHENVEVTTSDYLIKCFNCRKKSNCNCSISLIYLLLFSSTPFWTYPGLAETVTPKAQSAWRFIQNPAPEAEPRSGRNTTTQGPSTMFTFVQGWITSAKSGIKQFLIFNVKLSNLWVMPVSLPHQGFHGQKVMYLRMSYSGGSVFTTWLLYPELYQLHKKQSEI
jgi:hypothetical protein